MSDFDFEELDKAVAGALSTDTPSEQAEPSKPVSNTPSPASSRAPLVAADNPASEVVKETPKSASIVRRPSGRFMDVVHPSSDMRQRPAFTPPSPTEQPASSASQSTPETVQPTPGAPVATQEETAPELDGMSYEDTWEKPLDSPFLPGAKVNKRPLGGNLAAELEHEEAQLKLEAPDDPLLEATTMPDPIDFAAHATALASENEDTGIKIDAVSTPDAPDEVYPSISDISEIDAIEAIDVEPLPEEAPVVTEVTPAPQPVTEPEMLETPTAPVETAAPAQKTDPMPAGPMSISQQYTEQPSATQTSGAIYDTETYHKALPTPVKKRSSAWMIVSIIALVIFGAAAGAVFYLFILPML